MVMPKVCLIKYLHPQAIQGKTFNHFVFYRNSYSISRQNLLKMENFESANILFITSLENPQRYKIVKNTFKF